MRAGSRQSGVTLTELAVVMAVVALLAVLSVPAVRALMGSFESGSSTRAMIGAALASARAMAAKEQRYVGVRFQKAYNPDSADLLRAPQYMVYIMHDKHGTDLAYGFRAIEGLKPMKLPDSVGIMDWSMIEEAIKVEDWEPSGYDELADLTAFSIVFSPAGKLVTQNVRVAGTSGGDDDVFNRLSRITDPVNPKGMFVEDNDEWLSLLQEPSGKSFIIYDRREFEQAYKRGQGFSGYLIRLSPIYVNRYMGTLISTE